MDILTNGTTKEEMEAYAAKNSESIVIRYFVHGNSDDRRRPATAIESAIIKGLIYGAMSAAAKGGDFSTAKDAVEFACMALLPGSGGAIDAPHTNSYDTVYLPIEKWGVAHQCAAKGHEDMDVLDKEIRKGITEADMKEYAAEKGEAAIIRCYGDGAVDNSIKASPIEAKVVSGLIYGAVYAIARGGDIATAEDTAEIAGAALLPVEDADTATCGAVRQAIEEWVAIYRQER